MQAAHLRSLVKVLSSACRLTGGLWRALESHSSTVLPTHSQQQKSSRWLSPQEEESVVSDDKIGRCFTTFLFSRFQGLCGLDILRCKCSPVVPAAPCCDRGTAPTKIVIYTSPKQGRGSTWAHTHSSSPIRPLLVKS